DRPGAADGEHADVAQREGDERHPGDGQQAEDVNDEEDALQDGEALPGVGDVDAEGDGERGDAAVKDLEEGGERVADAAARRRGLNGLGHAGILRSGGRDAAASPTRRVWTRPAHSARNRRRRQGGYRGSRALRSDSFHPTGCPGTFHPRTWNESPRSRDR